MLLKGFWIISIIINTFLAVYSIIHNTEGNYDHSQGLVEIKETRGRVYSGLLLLLL